MDRWNNKYSGVKINNKPINNGNGNKYTRITINNKKYFAHRLASEIHYGNIKGFQVDHINGNTTDNSIKNLRLVSALENRKNMKLNRLNTTGISGVSLSGGKFRVQVKHKNTNVVDVTVRDFFEACCIRKSSENKYGYHENHGREC